MATKTVNRRPFNVGTDVDVDYKFFNHGEWKGICTNKNYMNLDQETFEDAKNVYIDANGVLKSRPAFKGVPFDYDFILTSAHEFPNNIVVYVSENNAENRSTIFIYQDDYQCVYGVKGRYHLLYDGKLYIFTTETGKYLSYYDEEQHVIVSVEDNLGDHVYIPITTVISNGVKDELEELNVLTDWHRERYIYANVDKITNPPYLNEEVTVITDEYEKTITFLPGSENTIFVPKFSINENNYYMGELLLDMSNNDDVILLSSVQVEYDEYGTAVNSWDITYSVDGRTFNRIPSPTFTTYGKPILSRDGSFVVVFGKDGPYAYSLLADNIDGTLMFNDWTNLLTYNGVIDSLPDIGQIITGDDVPIDNTFRCIGGTFISHNQFAYSYGTDPYGESSYAMIYYPNIQHVVVEDGDHRKFNVGFTKDDYGYDEYKYDCAVRNLPIRTTFDFDITTRTYYGGAFITLDLSGDEASPSYLDYYLRYDVYNSGYEHNKVHHGFPTIDAAENVEYGCTDVLDVKMYSNGVIQILARLIDEKDEEFIAYICALDNSLKNEGKPSYIQYSFDVLSDQYAKFSHNGIITDRRYHTIQSYKIIKDLPLLVNGAHVFSSKYDYLVTQDVLYTNRLNAETVYVDVLYKDGLMLNSFVPEHSAKLSTWHFSIGKDVYVGENKYEDDTTTLYIPVITKQSFDNSVTYLQPISETQLAIFFDDAIWYGELTEYGYSYYKSKLNVGLKNGGNVINSLDGRNIIFSSTEGLVYMSYEQLVQSSEQVLTYLSDAIYDLYKEYGENYIKLYLNKYWLYCYNCKSNQFLIFDVRNNSWWKWEFTHPILNIISLNNEMHILVNDKEGGAPIYKFSYDASDYFDYDPNGDSNTQIDWYVTSQKLHLGTLNYTKNVVSMIINNVETEDLGENVSYNLTVKNYRTDISNRYEDAKVLDYKVNMLRTYVKRCPSRKVNQFQYTLSNDSDNAIQLPLSIHSVIIKYTIGGQVR